MAYCTQADVEKAAGGAESLVALTDQNGTGAIDPDVLADAIDAAEEWINSYAQRQYKVPFAAVPDIIKRTCAEEAVYRLKYQRRATTADDTEAHTERLEWLRDLARSRVSVGVDPLPEASSSVVPDVGDRADVSGAINRDDLGGLW